MLSIILKILSILGIILLVLLGLILLILLLVLFFPICYRIKAHKHSASDINTEGKADEQLINADAKALWLFGLLRARYQYPAPGTLKVKLLFFTLYESEAASDNTFDKDFDDEFEDASNVEAPNDEASNDNASNKANTLNPKDDATENTSTDNSYRTQSNGELSQEEANKQNEQYFSPKRNLFEKIQYTIKKIYDKIRNVFIKIKEICNNIAYYKEILSEEDTKELLKHALMRLGKILKSLRPRKLRANIYYGADSPDITGYVCAIYGMIAHYLGKHVVFTPDFENEIFEGDIYASGHTTVFCLIWNIFMLLKDKRLWELRDKLSKEI